MVLNIIPVQGTFDIARGRNILRTHMAAHHWHPSEGARASALLTAIGELIMSAQLNYTIPIEVSIISEAHQREMWMRCTLMLDHMTPEVLSLLEQRISRVSDLLEVTHHPNQVVIMAHLYPDPLKEAQP